MSVLIKGMKMPECCFFCEMCYQDQDSEHNVVSRCAAQEQMEIFPDKSIRDENCPLVEIKPHGRLIDADRLIRELKNIMSEDDLRFAELAYIVGQPTIIGAEET